MTDTSLDVVCLGRAAVDLYGIQRGGRLEDVQCFARYLGGSSANLAAGLARLGRKSAMLTRVGNEQMGSFVREALAREGVDASGVRTDPARLTGLVILGIRSADDFPHIFFREHCADMGLVAGDVDAALMGRARVLALTGTHLSTDTTRAACRRAVDLARAAGARIVLDIDYRPVLWGLAAAADGAARFVASGQVTAALQPFVADCDLLVGTEEEIRIAGGSEDTGLALRAIRAASRATIVMKRGVAGCDIHAAGVDAPETVPGFPVEVLNVLGAGDAFLAGYLHGWLDDLPPAQCARLGNACGALVVSRHGCSPAMPTAPELAEFLGRTPTPRRPGQDARIAYLHRATLRRRDPRDLFILAFDHRRQLEQLALENQAPLSRVAAFKSLIAAGVARTAAAGPWRGRLGILVDDCHGRAVLDAHTGGDWWLGRPVEVPGSRPLQFEGGAAVGARIATWPDRHVIKCLVHYHPDDPVDLRLAQEDAVVMLHDECVRLERALLLEVISSASGQAPAPGITARIMERFYNLGVYPDWWKIEAPAGGEWADISAVITGRDPYCRGVLLLGLDVPIKELERSFAVAAAVPLCRGFAIGRSIFGPPARAWITGALDDGAAEAQIADNYRRVIETWQRARGA